MDSDFEIKTKSNRKRRFKEEPAITRDAQLILFGFLLAFAIPIIHIFFSSQGLSYIGFVIGGPRVEPEEGRGAAESNLVNILGPRVYDDRPELLFEGDSAVNLSLGGSLNFMRLSGSFVGSSLFSVFVSDGVSSYLVVNSSHARMKQVGYTKEFQDAVETLNGLYNVNSTKNVVVRLQYQSGSNWDADDDGIELNSSAVDFAVSASEFHNPVDSPYLCTAWMVYSLDTLKSHSVCFGGSDCCRMYGLESSGGSWDDTFYVYYGRLNATERDVVGASVGYANLNLESNLSGVARGGWEFLPMMLYTPEYFFDDVCAESCKLNYSTGNVSLVVKVGAGRLFLDRMKYSVMEGDLITLPVGRFILPARKVNLSVVDKEGNPSGSFEFDVKRGKVEVVLTTKSRTKGAPAYTTSARERYVAAGYLAVTTTPPEGEVPAPAAATAAVEAEVRISGLRRVPNDLEVVFDDVNESVV